MTAGTGRGWYGLDQTRLDQGIESSSGDRGRDCDLVPSDLSMNATVV